MDAASNVSALIVFAQGILSFFSPCVLPLIPLYVGYLMGGARETDAEGNVIYPRATIFLNTVGFVLGISFAFAVLGAGFSALGQLLSGVGGAVSVVAGVIMVLFGLYMLGAFGRAQAIEQERRLPFRLDRWAMSPLTAFVLGFTFSFAWTPCVGPVLASVLLMASASSTAVAGFALVGLYALGFCLPFLAVGLFTGQVLTLIRKHRSIVQAATKVGAALLIVMGVLTMTGLMNGASGMLARAGSGFDLVAAGQSADDAAPSETAAESAAGTNADGGASDGESAESSGSESSSDPDATGGIVVPDGGNACTAGAGNSNPTSSDGLSMDVPGFELADFSGTVHSLEAYRGKVVVLDFFTTWCTYCKQTLPDLQAIYEETGANQQDVVVLGVANPATDGHPNNADVSAGMVESFLDNMGVTYPTLLDETGDLSRAYQVTGYPTTVVIGPDGKLVKYVPGAVSKSVLENYVRVAQAIS